MSAISSETKGSLRPYPGTETECIDVLFWLPPPLPSRHRTSPRAAQSVLRMVPQANLTSIDPIWTTANITRNHGFMVYDTLYGLDASLQPQPQMAAGHQIDDDGRTVTITLRDGLIFHDGEKVRAADAVASLRRWMKRNPYGQTLEPVTDELAALDNSRLRFRLKKPFPLLFNALASIANAAFVMPERIAATDPFKQISDPTGSGPFRFNKQEFNSGSLVVYERNAAYRPRPDGAVSLTAGPKRVFFDRVEWRIITDAATAAAALQQGEIDWWEQPTPELRALFATDKNIVVDLLDPKGMCAAHAAECLAAAVQRQGVAPGVAAGDRPGGFHDGDRRRRSEGLEEGWRRVHARHADGERHRRGEADRQAGFRPGAEADAAGGLQGSADAADRADRYPGPVPP